MPSWRPSPPTSQIHGVALVGIHVPTTRLTGRPPSARMTFFAHYRARYDQRSKQRTHINCSPINPGHFRPALCQNCVTYPPKPRGNTVIYGDTLTHTVAAGSR